MSIKNKTRKIMNFNDNWGYYMGDLKGAESPRFDDSVFAPVALPHTMRLEKKIPGDVSDVYQGIGLYKRRFTLEGFEGKRVTVDFEGVMSDCRVYLNGEEIAEHNGGYMGFSVDITDKVSFTEENVLFLRVSSLDNPETPPGKPLASLDFHYYGGIYRNVYLRITDPVFITDPIEANEVAGGGVFITYPEVSKEKALVSVKTHVANKGDEAAEVTVKTAIKDKDGKIFSGETEQKLIGKGESFHFTQSIEVINPKLWHPETPYLYTALSEVFVGGVKTDEITTRIGIRRFEMKRDGLYVNGERVYLRGVNRHQCFAFIGDAAPDSMQRSDAFQIKQGGFNSVRAAHYPQSPAFLDACDELGILVVECQPGWQIFTGTKKFYDLTLRDAREMIRRDRNRPSVFLWETSLNETHYSAQWAKDVTSAAHEEYPGDQLFTAADYGLQGEYYDVNYKAVDGDTDYAPDKPFFTREWGDRGGYRQFSRARGERLLLWQTDTHEGFLNTGGYPDWGGLDANERIGGYFMWSWNDYARGYNRMFLASGCVEVDRTEKYLGDWLRTMVPAEKAPTVSIATKNSVFSHRTVSVYSNCDSVRLYRNGRFVKELTRDDVLEDRERKIPKSGVTNVPNIVKKGGSPMFKFFLPLYIRGELRAEGIYKGKVAAEHSVRTPGIPARITIENSNRGGTKPSADGSDIIPLHIKVIDKNGTLITTYYNKLHIEVSGEGELIGKDIPRIGAEHQRPSAGVCYALIRTSKNPGKIKVTVKGPGLKTAVQEFETQPYGGEFVKGGENAFTGEGVSRFEALLGDDKKSDDSLKKIKRREIKCAEASCESEEGRGPEKIIDGESLVGTGWLAKGDELPQSVTVTFKKKRDLSASRIFWEKDSSWYTYDLEVVKENGDAEKVFSDKKVGGQARNAEPFGKVYEDVKAVRITVKNVVSTSGKARTGIAEAVFYSEK